ncbi:DDE-type integrase/transposase/recombinase [Leptolyngbya sp. FACHB-541]|nr:DDE-type integrase/transposase/recombinase [Leptolyngbya sp. FACHB-541]
MNSITEQDHQLIKHIVKPRMGFRTFNTARKTLSGIEAMNMICKRQVKGFTSKFIVT